MSYTTEQLINAILNGEINYDIFAAIFAPKSSELEITDVNGSDVLVDPLKYYQVRCEINFIRGGDFYTMDVSVVQLGRYFIFPDVEDITQLDMVMELAVNSAYANQLSKPGFKNFWIKIYNEHTEEGKTEEDYTLQICCDENDESLYSTLVNEVNSGAERVLEHLNLEKENDRSAIDFLKRHKEEILITEGIAKLLEK